MLNIFIFFDIALSHIVILFSLIIQLCNLVCPNDQQIELC